jgi:predicted ATP-grasp superfamily ATP-dependent carboligase
MIAYVYILSNTATPGILKVGFTTRTVTERVAELNSQTGTIGVFSPVEAHEVPSNMAEAIETLAHSALRSDGKHFSKEYFKATIEECRQSILSAIAKTGAAERLVVAKEKERGKEEAKQSKAVEKRIKRNEKCEALYHAFLVETQERRRQISDLADQIDKLAYSSESMGFIAGMFSAAGKLTASELSEKRAELKKLFLLYNRDFYQFKTRNYISSS